MRLQSGSFFFFFFQAEDGIRDYKVTGVQTCALPISQLRAGKLGAFTIVSQLGGTGEKHLSLDDYAGLSQRQPFVAAALSVYLLSLLEIGRASCRERV